MISWGGRNWRGLSIGVISACFFAAQIADAADKVALIIGNSTYENGPDLHTPLNDSAAIARAFDARGYDTVLVQNVTNANLMRSLAELRIRSENADQVVIYFAGHGVQRAGQSFLLNVDAEFEGSERYQSMIPLRILIRAVSDRARQKILFIDACRDNPSYQEPHIEDLKNGTASESAFHAPAGSFVFYAAQPGAAAYDGVGQHSPFAAAFLSTLAETHELDALARHVRLQVIRATQGAQVPWSLSSLMRPVYLR